MAVRELTTMSSRREKASSGSSNTAVVSEECGGSTVSTKRVLNIAITAQD